MASALKEGSEETSTAMTFANADHRNLVCGEAYGVEY